MAVCFLMGIGVQKCREPKRLEGQVPSGLVVDTITWLDTIPYYLPEAKREVALGSRVTLLPVFFSNKKGGWESGAEAPAHGANKEVSLIALAGGGGAEAPTSGVNGDSVWVEIPITQREYVGKEYHAWVSGYEPRLDSIFVFPRREVVTIREPPGKPRRWGIGVFAGYGITPQGFQPCVGVSVNYNIWRF